MSLFDPQTFLDATTTEVNTKRPPLPPQNPDDANGLYTAMIGEIEAKSGEKDGKPWLRMVVPLKIQVPQSLQATIGMPEVTLSDSAFVSLTEQGMEDNGPGKNSRKRQYRDATGQNNPGQPFAWRMLSGRPVKVQIKHELYQESVQERIGNILPA